MTDTKIPMRIFTSYEALTEYYGERPDMELGLYVSDEKLLVGHTPTAYSFNPQYFTGENELEPNYVPASPIDYTINVAPNDTTYGYATGGGTYPEHTEITVNAYAYYGYKFDKWSNDVETSAYTFAVEEDADLTAYFVDNTYTVTTKPSAPGIGTTTGDGVYIAGTSVTVTATPAEGYYFADIWFDLDTLEIVSTDAEYTFTVEKNTNLRANFDIYRVVSATSNNSDYGSTTGAGQYKAGASVTVTATPNENYRFVNWTNNGTEVSTDDEYTFTVYDDTALVANFALITYTVTVSANDSSYGTVTGGGEYARGSNVTINAIPNSGYRFVNWTQGGIQVVTHPEYTLTLLSDATFVANFEEYLDPTEPFYVENITNADETLSIVKNNNNAPAVGVEYSSDKETWTSLGYTSTTALTRTITPGEKLYLRAKGITKYTPLQSGGYYNKITGVSKVGGNIMSLIYGADFNGTENSLIANGQFESIFRNNTTLQSAEKLILPILTFGSYYAPYRNMFQGCTALVTPPKKLPATSLSNFCYQSMFKNCNSLTTAPELPATYVPKQAYAEMFSLSSWQVLGKITNIKCLATSFGEKATQAWLTQCAATGTFVKAAGVEWPEGSIPTGWTVVEV